MFNTAGAPGTLNTDIPVTGDVHLAVFGVCVVVRRAGPVGRRWNLADRGTVKKHLLKPIPAVRMPAACFGNDGEQVDGYLKDMLNKCKLIRPEYMPITEEVEHAGKYFIVVWAPGGSMRPYSSPRNMSKDCRERVNWICKMASTIPAHGRRKA